MIYGSRICYGSKVVVKVKVVFDRQTDRRADRQTCRQTGQKLDAHRIGDSGGIKRHFELQQRKMLTIRKERMKVRYKGVLNTSNTVLMVCKWSLHHKIS